MQQNDPLANTPRPGKTPRIWLVVADLIAVAAIVILFGHTATGDVATIAAVIGVVAAGLFVVIPVLREKPAVDDNASGEIRALHESLRALADNLNKRLNTLEKQILLHSATPANFPALGEIADKIADLSTINSEDGDLSRIRTSLEEMQAQMDLLSEAVRGVENKLETQISLASAILPSPESDGPLPSSLMAKAFSQPQAPGSAVARLIGKALPVDSPAEESDGEDDAGNSPLGIDLDDDTDVNPPPPTVYPVNKYIQPGAMPAEDEIWHSAENMAGSDSGHPSIQQPDLLEELGLPPPTPKPRQSKHESALIVNVVIGIGNKPFVRGNGPGLNPDIGLPMEYVGIGRWRWVAPDHTVPAEITVWKNDILRAKGDPIILPPGSTVEASPAFPED